MIKKYLNISLYYLTLLLGLCATSWIIWSRFIRERTIRDIPDNLLTEYRFWILIYICCIYLYVVKNLLMPKEANPVIKHFVDFIFKPLTNLDKAIKYNKYVKDYYHRVMVKFVKVFANVTIKQLTITIFSVQIFPRIILVTFLVLDTFYFHKLELFYKVILIGVVPFIYRYIKYSIKEYYEYYLNELSNGYPIVKIYEVYGKERWWEKTPKTPEAIYHNKMMTLKEAIEIRHSNIMAYASEDEVMYTYITQSYATKNILESFYNKKPSEVALTDEDFDLLQKEFEIKETFILDLKYLLLLYAISDNNKILKWFKVVIFSLYFICWFYILVISYYTYPVELLMFKIFVLNLMYYLHKQDNIFINHELIINKNLLTKDVIRKIKKLIIK